MILPASAIRKISGELENISSSFFLAYHLVGRLAEDSGHWALVDSSPASALINVALGVSGRGSI